MIIDYGWKEYSFEDLCNVSICHKYMHQFNELVLEKQVRE